MALIDQATAFWRLGDPLSSNQLVDALGRGNDLTPFLRPAPVMHDFRMGSNNIGEQQFVGSLAKWGKWNRLLTGGEKSALYGGGTTPEAWPFNTTNSLKDAVVYYLLNEPSGSTTYADATGRGNSLLARGAVSQGPGPGGGVATKFDLGPPAGSLWRSYTADLQTGNYPWTICGWVNLTKSQQPVDQSILWGQWDERADVYGSPATSYFTSGTNVYYQKLGDSFALDGGFPLQLSQGPAIPSTGSAPGPIPWYFLMAEYDPAPLVNSLYFAMNNGTRQSLGPIQQPTPDDGKVTAASRFISNPGFSFGTSPTTGAAGWDGSSVDGNCHAYLVRNSNVSFGNNSFTVWGWVNLDNSPPPSIQTLLGIYYKPPVGTHECEYMVQYSSGSLYWVVGNSAGAPINFITVPITTGAWHLFVCWYDKANNTLNLNLDHGTTAFGSLQSTPPTSLYGKRRFTLGAASNAQGDASNAQQFRGKLNAVGIASGVPLPSDLDALWNGGNGIVLGNARRRRTSDAGQYPGYLWT